VIEDIVEILRRQSEFVLSQDDVAFFLQITPYLAALEDDPRVKTILAELLSETEAALAAYDEHDAQLIARLVEIRKELPQVAPDLDDPVPPPAEGTFEFSVSLAAFDQLASGIRRNQFPRLPSNVSDPSITGHLLGILREKLPAKRDDASDRLAALRRERANVGREHEHALGLFLVQGRTLAGQSYVRLMQVRDELIPKPIHDDGSLGRWEFFFRVLPRLDLEPVRKLVFSSPSCSQIERQLAQDRARQLRDEVKRLYEEVVRRLYRGRSRRTLVDRFKLRCESYDRARLRALASRRGKRESPLNAEAARFLFDHGLTPLIGPEVGGLRPDILASEDWTFYIESKQYGERDGRRTIREGAFQIWDTAGVLRAAGLREVYWLVFRRGGPRYVLPRELRADGLVVYPVHIDIAPSNQRGSRATRPVEIPAEELLPEATQHGRKAPTRRTEARS
jgi:hypothetical protein